MNFRHQAIRPQIWDISKRTFSAIMKYSTILSMALLVPLGFAFPTSSEDVIEEVLDLPLGEASSVNETESDLVSRQAGCYIQAYVE